MSTINKIKVGDIEYDIGVDLSTVAGILPIASGGTGGSTYTQALTNLKAAKATGSSSTVTFSYPGATSPSLKIWADGNISVLNPNNGYAVSYVYSSINLPPGLSTVQSNQPEESAYTLWVDTTEEADGSIMPADAVKFKSFSIATSAWSGSGPYTYQMTANGITADSAILTIQVNSASLGYLKTPLDWETGENYIKLSTTTKPTGTITGYCIGVKVVQI